MKKLLALTVALLLTVSAVGCGSSASSSSAAPSSQAASSEAPANVVLKVGASPAPHAEILESVKEALAAQGITLEITEFTDYVLPNNAVFDKSLDANYFQHQPYLTKFNEENKTDLVSAGSIHFEPLGIYPGKTASLEALADGAKIAVPNDPTNEARALNLLAANGIITLKEGVGLNATPKDIIENPKNIKIVELEAAQVPNALADVDLGVINGNYAVPAGIIDTVLVTEDPGSEAAQEFANIVAVSPAKKDDPAVAALIKALCSEETRKFISEKYGAAVIPVF
ncbi:MAG: MetQ/NlpA family ABC transporter substrate-binding protein [Angelakisella sp.]|nr:MetQ/NlpA family ABC transporter substrate-binding protein [Angelakisella sp.]